jgi:hypothetical protein
MPSMLRPAKPGISGMSGEDNSPLESDLNSVRGRSAGGDVVPTGTGRRRPRGVSPTREKLTPGELAKIWGISPRKVLTWIRSGELRAVNLAANARGARPRWRIDWADVVVFETRRPSITPPAPVRRRSMKMDNVIEFF